jgi:hypothetical protein
MHIYSSDPRFRLVSGPHGWGWVLAGGPHGQIVGTSAVYHPTVRACQHSIDLTQSAPLHRLRVTGSDSGGWGWELVDDSGRPLAQSVTSYGDSTRARSEMIQFRRVAVRAVPAGRIAEHPAARTGVASL